MKQRSTVITSITPADTSTTQSAPLYQSQPAAGFPAPGDDVVEQPLDLNDLLIDNPTATFFVRVSGDSMEGRKIFDGDILVVDRSVTPTNGMVVVAAVYGELVVKELEQTRTETRLLSAQDGYDPITIADGEAIFVWGVVISTVRSLTS